MGKRNGPRSAAATPAIDATEVSGVQIESLVVQCLLRYLINTRQLPAKHIDDEVFCRLAGHIRWPAGAAKTVRAALSRAEAARRFRWDDDEEGLEPDDPACTHPVDAALAASNGGYESGLYLLFSRHNAWLRPVLRRSLDALEASLGCDPSELETRLSRIGGIYGWNPVDVQVALAILLACEHEGLGRWLLEHRRLERDPALQFARLLGLPVDDVRRSIASGGALGRSGLVDFNRSQTGGFDVPPTLNSRLLALLRQERFDATQLLAQLLDPSPPPTLDAADFAHLEAEAQALAHVLQQAAHTGEPGVNILIYGPPGTGKTQFARWLIAQARLRGYEIPTRPSDGDFGEDEPMSDRLGLVCGAQRLLGGLGDAALIFDEAEDAFPTSEFGALFTSDLGWGGRARHGSPSIGKKAWINGLLESAVIPTVWICNATEQIDTAFLRRFTYHLEMRRPGLAVRRRIAVQRAQRMALPEAVALPLADFAQASPAMIDSALRYARLGAPRGASPAVHAKLALSGLRASLAVAGLDAEPSVRIGALPFDPAFIRLREPLDIDALVEGLRSQRAVSLCLHGVPGTGKTSFAEHLAERLGRPLHFRRASDLQDKYVGETEKHLREMFRQASDDGAVLLLDEADSFLFDRGSAERSWERSQVNELLQGMERFDGLFVAATNLFGTLDHAALRRFTFKLEFLPLAPAQRAFLALREFGTDLRDDARERLAEGAAQLDGLTPGDVAVVARRRRILGHLEGERRGGDEIEWVNRTLQLLRTELLARGGSADASVGFLRGLSGTSQ
jgi:AAA+ superfamily predicted ATPase